MLYLLDNTPNQPSKFKTRNWVEKNDGLYGSYITEFKTWMIRLGWCDYSDTYILVKGTITVASLITETRKKYLKIVHHLVIT